VTILFGGFTAGAENAETWEWDGLVWTQRMVSGPSPRFLHTMTLMRLAGYRSIWRDITTSPFVSGETWEWDGTVWTQRVV